MSYSSAHSGRTIALVYRSHNSTRRSPQKRGRVARLAYFARLCAIAMPVMCVNVELRVSSNPAVIGPWTVDVCPASQSDGVRR